MTNEEAIEVLRTSSWMCLSNNSIKFQKAIEYAYNNLKRIEKKSEENTKLKAEIEQWQSTNLKLTCELTRVECENHQLKSRNCQTCVNKGKCAIFDNFNIDYCSDWEKGSSNGN